MTAKFYDLCPSVERVRLNSEVRDDMTFMAGGQGLVGMHPEAELEKLLVNAGAQPKAA